MFFVLFSALWLAHVSLKNLLRALTCQSVKRHNKLLAVFCHPLSPPRPKAYRPNGQGQVRRGVVIEFSMASLKNLFFLPISSSSSVLFFHLFEFQYINILCPFFLLFFKIESWVINSLPQFARSLTNEFLHYHWPRHPHIPLLPPSLPVHATGSSWNGCWTWKGQSGRWLHLWQYSRKAAGHEANQRAQRATVFVGRPKQRRMGMVDNGRGNYEYYCKLFSNLRKMTLFSLCRKTKLDKRSWIGQPEKWQ